MPKTNQNPTALEKTRHEIGISRKKLAELSGVNSRAIEMYEQRRTNINDASVSRVRNIALALGVPIEKIIDNDDE